MALNKQYQHHLGTYWKFQTLPYLPQTSKLEAQVEPSNVEFNWLSKVILMPTTGPGYAVFQKLHGRPGVRGGGELGRKDWASGQLPSLDCSDPAKSPLVNPSSWGCVEGSAAMAILHSGKALEWQVGAAFIALKLFWSAFLLYKMSWGMKRESKWPWWSLPTLPPHGSVHCSAGCWSYSFVLFHQQLRWCSVRQKQGPGRFGFWIKAPLLASCLIWCMWLASLALSCLLCKVRVIS